MSDIRIPVWHTTCADSLESAILDFKRLLPGWWYSVGECQVSCDASCGPTVESEHHKLVQLAGDQFDGGFHIDLEQPSSLADALRAAARQAMAAIELARAR